jgi:hypothetical protein
MSEEQMTVSETDGGLPKEKKNKISAGAELIIPVSGVIFTLYYFTTIWNSPWTAQVSAFFIGAVLIFLSLIFMIRIARAFLAGEASFNFDQLLEPRDFIAKRLCLIGLTVAYIFGVQWGGFTLTTFVFLALAMMLLNEGRNKRGILILAAVLALSGWLLFIYAFDTRFPFGPFENLMKGVL